jgi:hypothetical protein
MGLKDEILGEALVRRNPTREKWLQIMKELGEEGAELEEVLNDPKVSPAAIIRVVKARGHFVTRDMVYGWRRAAGFNEH